MHYSCPACGRYVEGSCDCYQPSATPTPRTTCLWNEVGEMWETACGHAFTLIEGTPYENGMTFCCYCGKPLVEA